MAEKKKYEILIVDDVSENIKIAISILKSDEYNFSYALNAKSAIEILKKKRFDLLLLDVMMPGVDGFHLAKMIKNTPAIKDTPIIFVTAKIDIDSISEGFRIGAVDYVTKPYHPIELKARVSNHLELYDFRRKLAKDNKLLKKDIQVEKEQRLTEMEIAQKEIVHVLSELMERDSGETSAHVHRVAEISKQLALLEGSLSDEEVKRIYLAAPLHDVGKVLVDNTILHKKGPLSDAEFEEMKKHPELARDILKKSQQELIKAATIIAYEHHENWDGSGYPRGLKGEQIHLFGRIVAIADVLDALTHKRSYKDPWSFEQTVAYMMSESGKKFDPRLINLFLDHLEIFKEIIDEQ
ncbi:MAG: response regulator [Epsilonproteobacteria bacterium]|nr:response regulator [Campylobacterota bacterium]